MEPASSPLTTVDPSLPFADEVRELARANEKTGPAPESTLFYGSSSIRLWETLAEDFAGRRVLNRGFGGSTLNDCVREFSRLVAPVRPRALVFYAGDNDLDQGASPEHVHWLFTTLVGQARSLLGGLPIVTLAVKPSPVRFWNQQQIRQANQLIQAESAQQGVRYVDLFTPMLNEHGHPRRELFGEDGLHLSRPGYALWAEAVRRALPPEGEAQA